MCSIIFHSIRRAFDLARSAAPCVLFFDEIDSIIGGEQDDGSGMERGRSAEARVLSTFLNEMDGVDGSVNDGVLVLGATNRPATLDAALLRPGRFDKVIFVGLPDEAARADMIKMECIKWLDSITSFTKTNFSSHTILDKSNIEQFFNIDALACDNISGSMTGAEITHACEETAMKVIRKYLINSYHDLDITPAVAETLMNSLKNGLKKALQDQTPTIASTLEEYTRFNKDHLT
jgi:SpoVK/Ycf46/Vps4 family AAA+-type ATPase